MLQMANKADIPRLAALHPLVEDTSAYSLVCWWTVDHVKGSNRLTTAAWCLVGLLQCHQIVKEHVLQKCIIWCSNPKNKGATWLDWAGVAKTGSAQHLTLSAVLRVLSATLACTYWKWWVFVWMLLKYRGLAESDYSMISSHVWCNLKHGWTLWEGLMLAESEQSAISTI